MTSPCCTTGTDVYGAFGRMLGPIPRRITLPGLGHGAGKSRPDPAEEFSDSGQSWLGFEGLLTDRGDILFGVNKWGMTEDRREVTSDVCFLR